MPRKTRTQKARGRAARIELEQSKHDAHVALSAYRAAMARAGLYNAQNFNSRMLDEFKLLLDALFDEHYLLDILHEFYCESRLERVLDVDVSKLLLLYQATQDGWKNEIFKMRCWHHAPTLTIVTLDTGHMLGGVTYGNWGDGEVQRSFVRNPGSKDFLFSIPGNDLLPCFKLQHNEARARYMDASGGPSFGDKDLHIDLENRDLCRVRLGNCFFLPEDVYPRTPEAVAVLLDSTTEAGWGHRICEVEVFFYRQ